jgi:hypothetical protein
MTRYEKIRVGLIIVQILIMLGAPYIAVRLNQKLNVSTVCGEKNDQQ